MKVSGPISWSYYEVDGKPVHFFGDKHIKESFCEDEIYIVDLIRRTCDESYEQEKYLDIFIETTFSRGEHTIPANTSALSGLKSEFQKCLTKDKSLCKYLPYVKFHYIDIRTSDYEKSTLPIFIYYELIKIKNSKKPNFEMINKFVKIIQEEGNIIYDIYVSSDDGLKILKNLCSELQLSATDKNVLYKIFRNVSNNKLKKTSRIKKELSKINPDIKEKIDNYFGRRYNTSLSKLYDFWYSNEWIEVSSGRETDTERVGNVIEWFMEYIIELSASLMDVYAMARFYRTYEWTGETPCIFYVGSKHKRNYEGFLYEEFDIDSTYSDSGTKQCVYVKKWI